MEKNIILSGHYAGNITSKKVGTFESSADVEYLVESLTKACKQGRNACKQPLRWLQKYYSVVMEKEISTHQTLLLLQTQVAFVMGVFPADINLALRAAFLGWFAYSLHKCRKNF